MQNTLSVPTVTCSKVNSGEKCGKRSTLKHLATVAISCEQNDIFTKVFLKCGLQMSHVVVITCEVASILILYLKKFTKQTT